MKARKQSMGDYKKKVQKIFERISMYDLQNASPEKRQAWAEVKTDELEELYAEISKARKNIPKGTFDAWDNHCFEIIQKIIADRRANETRSQIARMMKLAGQHYGVDRELWLQRQAKLKQLRDRENKQ